VEEFSHTVLHGENFKNKIQNLSVAKPVIVKTPQSPIPRPSSAAVAQPVIANGAGGQPQVKYDPAKIYQAPVVRRPVLQVQKSNDKKIQDIRKRPPTPGGPRAPSAERESNDLVRASS
jgi:hypothetical protein